MKQLLFLFLLLAKAHGAGRWDRPIVVTLDPAKWYFEFGEEQPTLNPIGKKITGFWFDFPQAPPDLNDCITNGLICPQIDYLMTNETAPITNAFLVVTLSVQVTSGDPVFNYDMEADNPCIFPAHIRAILERDFVSEYGRWWSNPIAVELSAATGTQTMRIPIDPSQWSSVYGKVGTDNPDALAGFQTSLSNPASVGLTFGGGCFFGHGVNVSGGSARLILTEYEFAD